MSRVSFLLRKTWCHYVLLILLLKKDFKWRTSTSNGVFLYSLNGALILLWWTILHYSCHFCHDSGSESNRAKILQVHHKTTSEKCNHCTAMCSEHVCFHGDRQHGEGIGRGGVQLPRRGLPATVPGGEATQRWGEKGTVGVQNILSLVSKNNMLNLSVFAFGMILICSPPFLWTMTDF